MLTECNIRKIPLSQLKLPKWDIRYPRDPEDEFLEQLQEDIKNNGLIEPIIVRPLGDRRYEVIAGVYRVLAMRKLHKKEIPARIADLNDVDARCVAFRENEIRKEMESYKKAKVLVRLKKKFHLQVPTLAKKPD